MSTAADLRVDHHSAQDGEQKPPAQVTAADRSAEAERDGSSTLRISSNFRREVAATPRPNGRRSTDLAGVVSIHGSLTTSKPAEPGAVTAKILVCHGAADPHVPMKDVVTFTNEMNRADADWQLIVYGRAMHGFTHTHAVPGATPGVAYDSIADERSFTSTSTFLSGVLAPR